MESFALVLQKKLELSRIVRPVLSKRSLFNAYINSYDDASFNLISVVCGETPLAIHMNFCDGPGEEENDAKHFHFSVGIIRNQCHVEPFQGINFNSSHSISPFGPNIYQELMLRFPKFERHEDFFFKMKGIPNPNPLLYISVDSLSWMSRSIDNVSTPDDDEGCIVINKPFNDVGETLVAALNKLKRTEIYKNTKPEVWREIFSDWRIVFNQLLGAEFTSFTVAVEMEKLNAAAQRGF